MGLRKTTLLLLSLTLAAPALASHGVGRCGGSGGPVGLGIVEFGAGDPSLTFYVEVRGFFLGEGVYVYQESNGVYSPGGAAHDNLQRGGTSPTGLYSDPCRDEGEWEPDTLLY